MTSRLRQFVAEDLWLFIAVVTFGITSLVAVADFRIVAGVIMASVSNAVCTSARSATRRSTLT